MNRLLAATLFFMPCVAWAQQPPPPPLKEHRPAPAAAPQGAMQLLARCTQESVQMLDRITQLEAEIAALKSPPAEAGAPK